jgi:hypothetical protein
MDLEAFPQVNLRKTEGPRRKQARACGAAGPASAPPSGLGGPGRRTPGHSFRDSRQINTVHLARTAKCLLLVSATLTDQESITAGVPVGLVKINQSPGTTGSMVISRSGSARPPRYAYQAATPMYGDHGMGADRPSCTIAAFAPGC